MRIEIDKEEYNDLIETKEEFVKTVKKLENIIIKNIKLTDKLQAKEHELIMTKADLCRGCQYCNDYKNLFKTYKVKEQECEKFESRADELKNTLAKVNEKINRIVEIDGNAFDEALTNEIESIQNFIRKAIFTTGGNECQTKQ